MLGHEYRIPIHIIFGYVKEKGKYKSNQEFELMLENLHETATNIAINYDKKVRNSIFRGKKLVSI